MKTALLSKDQIEKAIPMDAVTQAVEEVYRAHGNDLTIMPPKITLDLSPIGVEAWTIAMPAYVHPLRAAGIKWVGGYLENPKKGLDYILAMIILQEPETGAPLAVMDGAHITHIRTGAAAGVCAKYFARPDSRILGVIGAGKQGKTSLRAISSLFHLKEAHVYDISPEASARYAEEMQPAVAVKLVPVSRPKDAVRAADIVVTATTANEAIVLNEWLKPGVVCVSLGSSQEFDDESIIGADKVIVDNWEQCKDRGELARLVSQGRFRREMIHAEMGEVVAGLKPGRSSLSEKIMVVPIGIGTLDIAVAQLAYQRLKDHCQHFEFF